LRLDLEPADGTLLTLFVTAGVMLAACSSLNGLRLDAFAIAANGPAEPIGTLLTRRRHTTNLTWPARSRHLRRANFAPLSLVALSHAEQRRLTGRLS
jgi:hypothetical protein